MRKAMRGAPALRHIRAVMMGRLPDCNIFEAAKSMCQCKLHKLNYIVDVANATRGRYR